MTPNPSHELPLDVPERWTVEPVFHRQTKGEIHAGKPKELKHYALVYGGVVQKKSTGERDTERLREMARFLNKKNLAPRPAVQCLADTNIPPLKRPKAKAQAPAEPETVAHP